MVDTPAASNDGMELPPVRSEGEVAADLTAAATTVLTAATQQLDRMRLDAQANIAAARAKADEERQAFEAEKQRFAQEKAAAEAGNDALDERITLDVGGQIFATTLSTLRSDPDSMLGAMFSGRHALQRTPEGHVFIDRDPTHFRMVINFLRDGERALPKALRDRGDEADYYGELLAEADFYQLTSLIALIGGPAARLRTVARVCGRIKEEEDELRALVVREPGNAALNDPALRGRGFWIDVFAETSTFVNEASKAPPAPIVLGGGRRGWRLLRAGVKPGECPLQPSLDQFTRNWRSFTLDGLKGLNWRGVVAAGGAVAGCALQSPAWARAGRGDIRDPARSWFLNKAVYSIHEDWDHMHFPPGDDRQIIVEEAWWCMDLWKGGSLGYGVSRPCHGSGAHKDCDISGYEESDVDLFLYGLDEAAARAKIKHIYCTLARNWEPQHIAIVRTQNVITFAAQWPFRRVQVILRLYSGPAEVLMGFDIDSCCVAYDGTSVSCLPRWRRAVNGSFNLVDPARRSPSYELRLSKYALRGFAVAVPAFDPKRLDGSLVTMEPGETDGLARLLIHAQDDAMNAEHVPRPFSKFGSRLPKDATGKGTTQWAPAIFRGRGSVGASNYEGVAERTMFHFAPLGYGHPDVLPAARINKHLRKQVASLGNGASIPFLASTSIDDVLCWPVGGFLKALGPPDQVRRYDPVTRTFLDYERLCAEMETARLTPSVPRVVEFLTQDPGRQYVTGSFHPDESDWYAQAYGEK